MAEVVLVGRAGMLGRAFEERLSVRPQPFVALDRSRLDISDARQVSAQLGDSTRVVINCAAWTDVDAAEANESTATRVNGVAVGVLGARCAQLGATLVHFSTDYVFSGLERTPYATHAPREPLNAYGRGKLLGERLLEQAGCPYLLIRTSWLYAAWGKNFVRTMLGLMKTRDSVRVVDDQWGRPSEVESVADATLALLDAGSRGIFHVTDGGQCSWFELARAIQSESGLVCEVTPCRSSEFERPARRPTHSVLSLAETEAVLGPRSHWREPLERVVARLMHAGSLLVALFLTALVSACSAGSEAESQAGSGVATDKRLDELSAREIESVCSWGEARAIIKECSDGSMAARFARDFERCVADWPADSCSATVADFEECLTTDPCQAGRIAEVCGPLTSCSFAPDGELFACEDGLGEVNVALVCDGKQDCADASDEDTCGEL